MKTFITSAHRGRVLLATLLLAAARGACADAGQSMLDTTTYQPLTAQHKAARIGDVLTVVVQEVASATSSVDLRAQRRFDVSVQADTSRSTPRSVAAGTETDSDGYGRTERNGRLLAQLSVRVTQINGNGDLVVAGEQQLWINGEKQLITLDGVVRPYDISDGNTVLSSRIADARIRFDGKGFVSRQSRPTWLARFLSWFGL